MTTPLYIPAPYQDSPEFGRLILRDGSTATVRVATLEDAASVAGFFHRLSPESRQRRFFSFAEPTTEFVRSLCDSSNPQKQLTLLVTRRPGDTENIIGAGTYIRRDEKTAEVAMAVDDTQQGKGIGTHLLERLRTACNAFRGDAVLGGNAARQPWHDRCLPPLRFPPYRTVRSWLSRARLFAEPHEIQRRTFRDAGPRVYRRIAAVFFQTIIGSRRRRFAGAFEHRLSHSAGSGDESISRSCVPGESQG